MSLFNRKKEEEDSDSPDYKFDSQRETPEELEPPKPGLGSRVLKGVGGAARVAQGKISEVNSKHLSVKPGAVERGDPREIIDEETGALVRFPGRVVIDSRTGKPIRSQPIPSRGARKLGQATGRLFGRTAGALTHVPPLRRAKDKNILDFLGSSSQSSESEPDQDFDYGLGFGSEGDDASGLYEPTEPTTVAPGIQIVGVIGNNEGVRVRWDGEEIDLYPTQQGEYTF